MHAHTQSQPQNPLAKPINVFYCLENNNHDKSDFVVIKPINLNPILCSIILGIKGLLEV